MYDSPKAAFPKVCWSAAARRVIRPRMYRLNCAHVTIAAVYAQSLDGYNFALCVCRLIAGGVAGMVSRASVAPFERMRTMYMVRQADGRSLGMGGEPLDFIHIIECALECLCHGPN